jgi:hypothetical protein
MNRKRDEKDALERRPTMAEAPLEIEARVRDKNQMTIPRLIAGRTTSTHPERPSRLPSRI